MYAIPQPVSPIRPTPRSMASFIWRTTMSLWEWTRVQIRLVPITVFTFSSSNVVLRCIILALWPSALARTVFSLLFRALFPMHGSPQAVRFRCLRFFQFVSLVLVPCLTAPRTIAAASSPLCATLGSSSPAWLRC